MHQIKKQDSNSHTKTIIFGLLHVENKLKFILILVNIKSLRNKISLLIYNSITVNLRVHSDLDQSIKEQDV